MGINLSTGETHWFKATVLGGYIVTTDRGTGEFSQIGHFREKENAISYIFQNLEDAPWESMQLMYEDENGDLCIEHYDRMNIQKEDPGTTKQLEP